ncbi:putative late blight resistance protein homolog r1a-6 [Phtheirospermum japonicum]|uniref:Putative late blight resistance protein homolog r1a-6 n=1 Tax=Phtheirospermum japonicum TaxID=374723 RepID=A0A830D281_9LAMI|nr:putative late blight resistance protein homolog r1a-6 [Phtheirospermum japonicum]
MLQNTTVGLDDIVIGVMDKLTGQQSNRQIIPIVGMGGIGKTTLARNIYVNPLIMQYFDFRGWATISQEYSIRQILLEIVLCVESKEDKEILSQMSEHELGDKLYKSLFGRRYLIVMDDMWSIEAWDKVKTFFPNNNDGSAIMVTTRLSNLAFQLSGSCGLEMSFLDNDTSWDLLCKIVFGEEGCPLELEETGKHIAKNCKGLPLSIVVIGGLLAKSNQTREHWHYIAENLNSIVNFEDNEHCLKILRLSYNQLPIHLKPCFLYMGIFKEDHKIHVSTLIRLWVAEGFLKPISGKNLEVAAKEYLKELIDRNLILVDRLGSSGNIRRCTIHDLLRDLCIKEAEKDKFFCVAKTQCLNMRQSLRRQRRIGIHGSTLVRENIPRALGEALQSAFWVRSVLCNIEGVVLELPFRLLWVFSAIDEYRYIDRKGRWSAYPLEDIFKLVNLRHLVIVAKLPKSGFPSSVFHLWNLQTFAVVNSENDGTSAPFNIWKMPQLRHVKIAYLDLPDPPVDPPGDSVIMANLQMLSKVYNFRCGEEVVKRIPNIKKLRISYGDFDLEERLLYRLDNLCRLRKLESLYCAFSVMYQKSLSEKLQNLSFPLSLKKLALDGSRLNWDDMATKIGLLPNLQVLKLTFQSFVGPKWETVEGQFCKLKLLLISFCTHLEYWTTTDNTHFPCLEHVVLRGLSKLKEIPSAIGDIPTLRSVEMEDCSDSAIISAKEIVEKQEVLGNEGLLVRVRLWKKNKKLESLASHNFIVE